MSLVDLLSSGISESVQALSSIIVPPTCHLCGERLADDESFVCTPCLASLPRTLYHRHDMNPMAQRFAGFFPFERVSGVFFYSPNSSLAQLIQDFKYRKFPSLARRLGRLMAEELSPTGFLQDIDIILPIPMFRFKQALRGYNQTQLLAQGIADCTQLMVGRNLIAPRAHKTQTRLSHSERDANVKDVFAIVRPGELSGKHLLIIDDICTTGATLRSAATLITETFRHSATPPKISLLTLGVTQR
ncbi:MAG: hypothetical protein NC097_07305 [Clostridium sp.]|nr:hypothetical protein [Prevotella sp.]MCM1429584.1 hypothetical protein [Clostridium sp.]MCM1476009.1 hypothetical protein [Muribaculaceae bacterium]